MAKELSDDVARKKELDFENGDVVDADDEKDDDADED